MIDQDESRTRLANLLNELTGSLIVNSIGELMSYLQQQDISPPRFMALQNLEQHPGITITTLAQQLKLTLGSASQLIDRLENDGLVSRQEATYDRRVRHIYLLPKGQQIIDAIREMMSIKVDAQFKQLPIEHVNALYTALINILPYLVKENS